MISSDGNPEGVSREKEGSRGRLLTATGEGDAWEYWYAGTDTGDYRVSG